MKNNSKPNNKHSLNNFHFIRLLASIMVIFSHSYYLIKSGEKDIIDYYTNGNFTFGSLGVYIFLIVSGYLISNSLVYSSSLFEFFKKRFLRIFPALWTMILVSVFVIGPIFSKESVWQYFKERPNYEFLKNVILFLPTNLKIPSLFISNPNGAFNGSLWTIPYEVFFYFFLFIIYRLRLFTFKTILLIQWIVFVILHVYLGQRIFIYSYSTPWLLNLNVEHCFRLFIYFEAGVLLFLFKKILFNKFFWFGYLGGIILIFSFTGISNLLVEFSLPPLIIYFAISNSKFAFISSYGDFSYGMYLYSYIVQQILVSYNFYFMNSYVLFFLSTVLSFIVAYASWHYVEEPSLKLKDFRFTLFTKKKNSDS
jgi:peptidoglycan/LPS O-acetylase OafA/YrhL